MTADELIDKAYKRGAKAKPVKDRDKVMRARRSSIDKINIINDVINSTLSKYVSIFPSFDNLPRFYYELIDVLIGIDDLKKSLGAIDWCRKEVRKVSKEITYQLKTSVDYNEIFRLRKAGYGRIASIVKQVAKNLDHLGKSKDIFERLPEIDPELTTIVIAGYPNVGKSLIVKGISTANPKIAKYPFTTQNISIGYFEVKYIKYQVIDTPGLLDRDLEEQNMIERQATSALRHLADVIVFIIDPSEHCGYTLEVQLNLLERIKKLFGQEIPILEVENKVDIKYTDSDRVKISAITGAGVEVLIEKIIEVIPEH
jgi:nucleolar GTP-binding protein